MNETSITSLDWIIIAAYGGAMLIIGLYFSLRNKSSDDYMLGGRSMNPLNVGISLFATMFSAISYLSYPGEIIKYGPMIFIGFIALPLVYFVVAYYFIPFIMKLNVSSAYELLENKVGAQNRIIASFYFLTMRILWMSVIIYMVSDKIIIPIMGWSESMSFMVSVAMGIITIIYTSFGGLRSVIFTDVVQSVILFLGTIIAIILIGKEVGDVKMIIPDKWPEHWTSWVFFDTGARVSFMTAFISTFGWFVCTAGSDQMAIQRYLATRDVNTARKMYGSSLITNVLVIILLVFLGMGLLAYIKVKPELGVGTTILDGADSLFPRFIAHELPSGFSGILLAGLLAAAMSSLSSGINSSSLSIVDDFVLRFRNRPINENQKLRLAKLISVLIGAFIVILSFGVDKVKGNLLEITYKTSNLFVAPLFVPFFMAMFIPFATPWGTFIGTVLSGIAAILIGFSYELFGINISFLWIIPVSLCVGVVCAIVVSLLIKSSWFSKNNK